MLIHEVSVDFFDGGRRPGLLIGATSNTQPASAHVPDAKQASGMSTRAAALSHRGV
jgi:uncharacterized protein involved in type VI secretion and phage assembly